MKVVFFILLTLASSASQAGFLSKIFGDRSGAYCNSRLTRLAGFDQERAREICEWNSNEVIVNCIVDLTLRAPMDPEVALDSCYQGYNTYKNELGDFQRCVIELTRSPMRAVEAERSCLKNKDQHARPLPIVVPAERKPTPTQPQPQPPVVQTPVVVPATEPAAAVPQIQVLDDGQNYIVLPIQ